MGELALDHGSHTIVGVTICLSIRLDRIWVALSHARGDIVESYVVCLSAGC
jgi:hypothetical protein